MNDPEDSLWHWLKVWFTAILIVFVIVILWPIVAYKIAESVFK